MEKHVINILTVLEYASMSNGRSERMISTIELLASKMIINGGPGWFEAVLQVVLTYYLRSLTEGHQSHQLLYGIETLLGK